MELFVHKINGKKTSKKIKLDISVFGVEPNNHAIYLDVKSYLANKRQGTHKTKQRADIKGSTRKIKRGAITRGRTRRMERKWIS